MVLNMSGSSRSVLRMESTVTRAACPFCGGRASASGRIFYADRDDSLPLPICHRPGCSKQWRDEGYEAAYQHTYCGDDVWPLDSEDP
jgi:hypothetical protein